MFLVKAKKEKEIDCVCSHHRESAMALNSLYPDGWFALGAAALKVTFMICIMLIVYLLVFCTITIIKIKS